MTLYRMIGADGLPTFGSTLEGEPLPDGAVEAKREPGAFEDFVDGAWVYDAKGHANKRAGPEHIAEARAQKRIEALLIKSGVALAGGLLAAEAGLRKITPDQMADMVIAKADAFVADELARQDASIAPVAVDAKP